MDAHNTGDPCPYLEVERSKVKVTMPLWVSSSHHKQGRGHIVAAALQAAQLVT